MLRVLFLSIFSGIFAQSAGAAMPAADCQKKVDELISKDAAARAELRAVHQTDAAARARTAENVTRLERTIQRHKEMKECCVQAQKFPTCAEFLADLEKRK